MNNIYKKINLISKFKIFGISLLATTILTSCISFASSLKIQTSGDPTCPTGGRFYGYINASTGPGDDSFEKILALSEENHKLLFIVYGRDGCSTCQALVDELNVWARAYGTMLAYGNSLNAYFHANASGTGPKACMDCYNFMTSIGATGTCHIMACWGICEDGTIYKATAPLQTSYEPFGSWKVSQCDTFNELAAQHQYVPPASNVAFVYNNRLEATEDTEFVYVPLVRTNNFASIETCWLKATYPDGSVVSNKIIWSSNTTV